MVFLLIVLPFCGPIEDQGWNWLPGPTIGNDLKDWSGRMAASHPAARAQRAAIRASDLVD